MKQKYQLELKGDNLPAGIYLIEFKTNDYRIMKKIIKAHPISW